MARAAAAVRCTGARAWHPPPTPASAPRPSPGSAPPHFLSTRSPFIMMYERRTLVAALAATTLVASATAAMPPSLGDGFYQGEERARESECERGRERGWWNDENPITPLLSSPGRATFFGASKQFEDAFSRGKKDAFGDFVSRKRENGGKREGERARADAPRPTRPPPSSLHSYLARAAISTNRAPSRRSISPTCSSPSTASPRSPTSTPTFPDRAAAATKSSARRAFCWATTCGPSR